MEFLPCNSTVPVVLLGKTAGLLGHWDDDNNNDFLLPSGGFVSTNSSSETIHREFGEKCK